MGESARRGAVEVNWNSFEKTVAAHVNEGVDWDYSQFTNTEEAVSTSHSAMSVHEGFEIRYLENQ
jgi:hypothetical protein